MKVHLLSLALLVPVFPAQAEASFFRYLEETAGNGEAESQFILGLAYTEGWNGTLPAGSPAAQWYEMASELGDQRPVLVLGLMLREKHHLVEQDRAKAVQLLTQAAAQGDDYARVILGDMLLTGAGVPADWRSGAEWIRKSANARFAPAQFRLGLIYLIGGESTPKDEVEALAWFILAAESGSKSAQEYRDERTQTLGREVARLAIKRSLKLLVKDGAKTPEPEPTGNQVKS